MATHATAGPAPVAPPALPQARTQRIPTSGFAALAALGAAFAGLVSWHRNPDPLPTALVAGVAFGGAFLGLCALHIVSRLVLAVARVAVPVAAVLLLGCALDWHWAETAVDWLQAAGSRGVDAAARGWAALRTG